MKLYLYQNEGERTIVDSFEAEDFGDFVLIRLESSVLAGQDLDLIYQQLSEAFEGKKIIFIDKNADISFYGIKESEEDDSRSVNL